VRTLAALIIALWSAQLPLCALADGIGRAAAQHVHDGAAPAGHDHGSSHGPSPSSGDEESCVEHCQKLLQILPQQAPALDAPVTIGVPPALFRVTEADFISRGDLAFASAFDRAPPSRAHRTTVLRL
jgi:hypothetical protein